MIIEGSSNKNATEGGVGGNTRGGYNLALGGGQNRNEGGGEDSAQRNDTAQPGLPPQCTLGHRDDLQLEESTRTCLITLSWTEECTIGRRNVKCVLVVCIRLVYYQRLSTQP